MSRIDGRTPEQLRPITIERGWSKHAEGSVLVSFGDTRVFCTASVTEGVPRWRKGSGEGWVTAEPPKAALASSLRSLPRRIFGQYFADHEDFLPSATYRFGHQFLGPSAAIHFCRIDQTSPRI